MRSTARLILLLMLAAFLSVALRLALEAASFDAKFHWPPGWFAEHRSSYRLLPEPDGPSGNSVSIQVRGVIQQQVSLVNGSHRPVRVSLRYKAPQGGAWVGLAGDAGSFTELRIHANLNIPVPAHPNSLGVYRVSLPATAVWKNLTFRVEELTDLPWLTLYLGEALGRGEVRFADVHMAYVNAPDESLLENAQFLERWPLWMKFPEWITPGGAAGWAPARFVMLLAVLSSILWMLRNRRLKADGGVSSTNARSRRLDQTMRKPLNASRRPTRLPRPTAQSLLIWTAWVTLSALLLMGSGEWTELVQVWMGANESPMGLGAVTDLTWLLQIGLFILAGWFGFGLIGRSARFGVFLIVILAVVIMSPGVGILMPNGTPTPLTNFAQFTDGLGSLWLITGAIAAWGGVLWAEWHAKQGLFF